MRTSLGIIFYFLFAVACKNKNKVPNGIIPPDKMKMVMWDMIRADEFLTSFVLNSDSLQSKKSKSIRLYEQVFQIHHINKEIFQNSIAFYRVHPSMLKIMMDSLSAMQKDTSIEQRRQKTIPDSFPFRRRHKPIMP